MSKTNLDNKVHVSMSLIHKYLSCDWSHLRHSQGYGGGYSNPSPYKNDYSPKFALSAIRMVFHRSS
jgi:hypothetical protein